MAYAVKYLFKFQSSNGTVREIRVLKDGYSGDVIQRPLGRAPVIKKEKNGGIHGTSLTFYAECHIDREYIEFYTSDPKEYRVDVYAGSTLLWQGYITPELYSEPDIAPPYDVQVVATDGVGELKLYDFAPQGTVTLRALLTYLLGYTGLTTDVNLVSSLKPGSRGAGALLDMQICVDYLAGKTCYEALTYILTTLHATITRWGGAWVLVRETNVTFTSDKVRYFNTSGNSALLTGSVQTLGAMRSAPAWPVGQLSTVIDPAKNKVVVQAPWHPVTGLTNPDMTSDTGWTKSNGATYSSGGYLLPNVGSSAAAFISQTLPMAGLRTPTSFELRVTGVSAELGTRSGAVIGVLITYTVGSTVYLLRKGDEGTPVWQQGADPGPSIDGRVVDYQQPIASFDADRIQAETLSIEDIPAFVQGTSYPSGTLKIYIVGVCARVYGAHLDVVLPKGYQDVLRIDNGARGEGDSVEIAIGRVTSEVAYYQSFLQGLLLDTGSIITAFSDANFTTAMDYLALISRDYALSAALPRALAKGTVYLESSISMPPLVFAKGGLNYWLETWSWDLYEDELEIDARTLPSASLTVQSETILESDGSTVSSSSSGSSGSGSSISPGGGVTYFEPHNDGIILKADYEYVSVPDVLLGEDEESLTSLLAIIAGNAAQGAAAYGYFNNGVLGTSHLPALYLGTTQIQTSSAAQAVTGVTTLTMSGKLTIGGAEIEWVPAVGTTPGYLKINSALLTDGDQIVGGGTPGGGGGGGAGYLYELGDVYSTSSAVLRSDGTTPAQPGDVLSYYDSTKKWVASNDIVHLAGAQTITGTKTFSSGIKVTGRYQSSGDDEGVVIGFASNNYAAVCLGDPSGARSVFYFSSTGGAPFWRYNNGTTSYNISHPGKAGTIALTSDIPNVPSWALASTKPSYTFAEITAKITHTNEFNFIPDAYDSYVYFNYRSSADTAVNISKYIFHNGSETIDGRASVEASSFIKYGGTSAQFLKADGSVDSSTYLTTGAAASTYLPLSAGSEKPLTGDLYLTAGKGIEATGGAGLLVYHPSDWTGISSTQWGVGASDSQGVIRSGNNDLIHYRNGSNYTIWDGSNSNGAFPWACSTLSATTTATIASIEIGNTNEINGVSAGAYTLNIHLNYRSTGHVSLAYGGGNVGVGVLNPSYKLQVSGTTGLASGHLYLTGANASFSTANTTQIVFGTSSSNHVAISSTTDAVIINPTTSTTTGQIILGVNSTTSKFGNSVTFNGADNRFESATWNNVKIKRTTSGGAWICFYPSNQETAYWDCGAGGETTPLFKWEYSGATTVASLSSTGVFTTNGDQVVSSDINLKTNLAPVTYGVEDIAKTRAVTFDWKDGRGHSAGSIAQDWKPLIPELVHGEEGNMTLAYGQIALVNTIIEAREIDVLKKRVAELEAEVQRLRS